MSGRCNTWEVWEQSNERLKLMTRAVPSWLPLAYRRASSCLDGARSKPISQATRELNKRNSHVVRSRSKARAMLTLNTAISFHAMLPFWEGEAGQSKPLMGSPTLLALRVNETTEYSHAQVRSYHPSHHWRRSAGLWALERALHVRQWSETPLSARKDAWSSALFSQPLAHS